MPSQETPTNKPKRFRRKLTPFLCREMLYDYATNQLDPDRRMAVEEFIKTDKESQTQLEIIKESLKYLEALSTTKLAAETLEQLKDSENLFSIGRRYSTWKSWPETLRWSVTAIFVSSVVAALVGIVPWGEIPLFESKKTGVIEVAQIPMATDEQLDALQESAEAEASGSGHLLTADGEEVDLPPSVAAKLAMNNDSSGDQEHPHEPAHQGSQSDESPVDLESESAPVSQSTASAKDTARASSTAEPASISERKDPAPKGFVYRAFMNLSNLEEIGPKIADDIRELGGAKAGQVELGWNRGTGRYYHFSLPATNEEKVLEKLRVYGPVRISKDPHPRVMPEGQVRFILWIESAN